MNVPIVIRRFMKADCRVKKVGPSTKCGSLRWTELRSHVDFGVLCHDDKRFGGGRGSVGRKRRPEKWLETESANFRESPMSRTIHSSNVNFAKGNLRGSWLL
jgi:hypothetical protein